MSAVCLKKITKLLFLAVVVTAMPASAATLTLQDDTWLQGVKFKKGTTLETYDMTPPMPKEGTLAQSYSGSLGSIWAADSKIKFDNRGNVIIGTMFAGAIFDKQVLSGAIINVYPNGNPANATFTDRISLSNGVTVTEKTAMNFYSNGSVKSATLAGGFTFISPGSQKSYSLADGYVEFWPLSPADPKKFQVGSVKTSRLAMPHVNVTDVLPVGVEVGFDGAGELNRLVGTTPFTYRGIELKSGGLIEITANGFSALQSYAPVVINGVTYAAGSFILLNYAGTVVAK